MNKKLLIGLPIVVLIAVAGYYYNKVSSKFVEFTPEVIAALNDTVASENESAIKKPAPRAVIKQATNTNKNVYFGDLHVHTSWSFDGYLGGNRIGPSEAYKFAQGKAMTLMSGEQVQLSAPLDFAAITDHAESFGLFEGCADPNITESQAEFCKLFDKPSISVFYQLRKEAIKRPPQRMSYCGEDGSFCINHAKTTWQKTGAAAEQANNPGTFTAFHAYEYSPAWPKGGSTHRNVIFRNSKVPTDVVSAYDAATAVDLWQILEDTCVDPCEFLTIPHNLNRYYGKSFSPNNEDGVAYTKRQWQQRKQYEPLVELIQTKGNSECAIGVNTSDEECGFEQYFELCDDGESIACAGPNSYARDGLKFGLGLAPELSFNPLQFGFVGSTDVHNSNPGDTDEWDYRGKSGIKDASAKKRLGKRKFSPDTPITHNPGGLAAIWAVENTRDALFDSMQAKETYATSGTRIKLRFFAFWDLPESFENSTSVIADAYAQGVPMGRVLPKQASDSNGAPSFFIWAAKDPVSTNLEKVQMVKSWVDSGLSHESVVDIACAGGKRPSAEGSCPENDSSVNLTNCEISKDEGDTELVTTWQDPDFNAKHDAFYYVRVIQSPSCRWSSYDAIRLGIEPIPEVSPTIQERAWSSPIWYVATHK